MHIDAKNLENNSLIEGDICIVGAGAAGISMAMEWNNTPHKVILLEGGGFKYEDEMQELYAGKSTGQHYYPMKSIRLHYFGGTTGHWAGWCAVFDEIDFKKRDWIPQSGWPITLADINPFYPRAQRYVEVDKDDFTLDHWLKKDKSFKPFPLDETKVWSKMWQFSPPTRFGEKYKDSIVNSRNVHLYTYANVVDIAADESVSAIREVTVKNLAGKQHRVRAKYFILACCSVQNARLLLASNKQAKNGLGNDHDKVGRNFMEHLEMKTSSLWVADPADINLYKMDFGKTKARAELAIGEKLQEKYKILNGTSSLTPLEIAIDRPAFIEIWQDEENALKKGIAKYDETKKQPTKLDIPKGFKAYELFTRMEQAPNPNSRITLDTEKDALGMPRAKLHWELTHLERDSLRDINRIIGQEVGRASMGRVKIYDYLQKDGDPEWPSFTGGGWHHMGTTRMSEDPKQGVTDANCKVHGIRNLYVAGASNFVTAGAVNPTLTLIALTMRLSDELKKKIKK
ncbi:GMC family oxidoreductase [Pollutibacter soli]|uniref:GMC family oxidoreductase n=1 Tax=Pollutibacter soli TaxID=3034157 RepID=UPI003013813E